MRPRTGRTGLSVTDFVTYCTNSQVSLLLLFFLFSDCFKLILHCTIQPLPKAAAKKVVGSSQVTERQKEARARREAQSARLRALRATKSSEAKNGANWSFSN